MQVMLPILVAVFLSGISSKMLDGFLLGRSKREIAYFLANAIFVLIGAFAVMALSPAIAISLLIALPLMGKIDRLPLQLAYIAVLAITLLLVRDFSALNPVTVGMLAVCAAIDETDLPFIRDFRPAMLAGSALLGLFLWDWRPLLAISLFDLGYGIAARLKPNALKMAFGSASKV
jgi:predicted neutral ceramidase superfamily lipid hydrolase